MIILRKYIIIKLIFLLNIRIMYIFSYNSFVLIILTQELTRQNVNKFI